MNYERLGQELEKQYDVLPNPVHEPIQFMHILKLFRYYNKELYEEIESDQ